MNSCGRGFGKWGCSDTRLVLSPNGLEKGIQHGCKKSVNLSVSENVAVGESDAEVTVIQAFEMPGYVAAKGENAVAAEGFDPRCGGCFKVKFLVFNTKGDEVIFEA